MTHDVIQCAAYDVLTLAQYRHVNALLKRWVYQRRVFSERDVGTRLYTSAKKIIVRYMHLYYTY